MRRILYTYCFVQQNACTGEVCEKWHECSSVGTAIHLLQYYRERSREAEL